MVNARSGTTGAGNDRRSRAASIAECPASFRGSPHGWRNRSVDPQYPHQQSRWFEAVVLTENQERPDAILRGAVEDLVFTEVHASSNNLNAHMNLGSGRTSRSSNGGYGGLRIGESDSEHCAERRHKAIAAVRLVSKDGDVIWSTGQESLGAKSRGARADVADKITSKLKDNFEGARKLR